MKSKKYLVLLALIIGSCYQIAAQKTFEQMQKIEKSYLVNKNALIQINNKYGNVHISTWDKDSVKFDINFIVRANKQDRLSKLLSVISFDFNNSPSFVIGQTMINKNSILTDVASMANAVFGSGTNIIINYNVSIPENSNIKIENKFGDIFLTDINGNADISLSNGDLKTGNINGELKLKHSFGNATLKNFQNGRITLSFSEFEMNKTKELYIESSSSRIQIGDVETLDYNLRNDKLYLSNVETLKGKSNFSKINIKKINQQAIITSSFGSFNLDEISTSIKLINITSSYTSYTLFAPRDCSFNIDVNYRKTDINLPASVQNYKKELLDAKTTQTKISGIYGNSLNPSSRININSTSGNIYLYEK
ncbi:MAG: hypothetical protein WCK02_09690 [Bacteroidota bacterium]